MAPSARLRALLVGLLLVGAGLATPAGAAAPSSLRGTAGSWDHVTLHDDVHLDWRLSSLRSLTADRGPYVGFALVGPEGFLTYVKGRHDGRACAFGARCEIDDWPEVFNVGSGRTQDDGYLLRKGRYRIVLLGAPGARVEVRSTLPFLAGVRSLGHRGGVQLQPLASTTPPVGDAQPRAGGAAAFESTGEAVTGLVWRVDAQYADSAEADVCIGSGSQTAPPQTGVCEMGESGGVSEGSYVGWGYCPVVVVTMLCLPGTTEPVSVAHGLAAYVSGGSHVSYDMTVKAARARISGWAFSVRF